MLCCGNPPTKLTETYTKTKKISEEYLGVNKEQMDSQIYR